MSRWLLILLLCVFSQAAPTVTDDGGHALQLAKPARRIVSLSPHATELLFAVGAGNWLVGRDAASDFPAEAIARPVVGQYGAFNVEAILALKPDLVIAWEGPQAGAATARLRELGIPVFATQPSQIDAIPATVRALGVLTGKEAVATRVAHEFETGWAGLKQRYQSKRQLTVIAQVGSEPAMTVNDQQFVAAVFRACGTRNPFGHEQAAVPLLSAEAILMSKPDAIVALASPEAAERWFSRWRNLSLKLAYLAADPNTLGRPSLRLLATATTLCARLDALRQNSAAKID